MGARGYPSRESGTSSWRHARSGTGRSPSAPCTSRSSSTRPRSPRSVSFTEVHLDDGAKSSTGASAPRRTRRCPTRRCPGLRGLLRRVRRAREGGGRRRGRRAHAGSSRSSSSCRAADIDPVFFDKTYYVGARDAPRTRTGCCTTRSRRPAGRRSGASPSTTASTSWRSGRTRTCSRCTRCASPTSSCGADELDAPKRVRKPSENGDQDGRAAGRDAARALQARRLRGHLPRGGARRDRAQGATGKAIELPEDEAPSEGGDDLAAALEASLPEAADGALPVDRSLSFGLVNVPVALYSGVRDRDLHFRQLHEKDGAPIEVRRFCSEEDKEVPFEAVGHGYELDGKQVVLTDEELARRSRARRARSTSRRSSTSTRSTRSTSTTRTCSCPPARPRARARLPPARRGHGAHRPRRARPLRAAHQGVPGAIRARDGQLVADDDALPRRGPADEGDRPPAARSRRRRQLDEAVALIEALTDDWDPERYEDRYRKRLRTSSSASASGRRSRRPSSARSPSRFPDLMAALEKTLADLEAAARTTCPL